MKASIVNVLIIVLGAVRIGYAEVITVPFSGVVTQALGRPFGIQAQIGVTPVTGEFSYDTSSPSAGELCTNCQNFYATAPSSFVLQIEGVTIASSKFTLSTSNNVNNFGGSDLFRASADSDSFNSIGPVFLVNGIPWQGSAHVDVVDTDQTLYATDADAHVLPTLAQLQHGDFFSGFLSDDLALGGENGIRFRSVPEPAAGLLLLTGFQWILWRRNERTNRSHHAI